MHGRTLVSTGALAATLGVAAILGGCRDNASTGPSHVQSKDFAAALRSVQGDQQVGSVGAALAESLEVKVVDANGLPVEGATVTFAVRSGGGAIIPPGNVSSATGYVSAVWILGTTLGPNKAVAVLTNGFVLDSAVFNATATPGAPAVLTKISGDTQTAHVGQRLAAPLVVKLTDQFGYAKSGVKVTWVPTAASGTVAAVSDTTSADGTAQAAWTLGQLAQNQSATANVPGTTPIVFTATATPDTLRALTSVQGAVQTGSVSVALPTTLKVRVTDEFGNPIVGEPIQWSDSIGGGFVSALNTNTAADGTAQVTWTLGNHAGTQLVVATDTKTGSATIYKATATVAFSDVFAGNFQACGIAAVNQAVYCWGNNDAGQLAKGTTVNSTAPSAAVAVSSDTLKGPFLQVRQLSGGQDQFCALSTSRSLYCWGRVLGGAPVNNATRQALTTGGSNGQQEILANSIAVGEEHVCILADGGIAFCTGVNYHGQLGDGLAPVTPAVGSYTFVVPFNFLWSKISAGANHTCGVPAYNPANANSQLPKCWGLNSQGQVGNGTLSFADVTSPQFLDVTNGVTAYDSSSIATGTQHSCAIALGGVAYCWGNNAYGQLGTGGTVTQASRDSIPTAVQMPAGVTFVKLFAGQFHTCAIDAGGNAWCWGRNDYGQLGNGLPGAFNTGNTGPVMVAGGLQFRSLSLGELYTCGVVAPLGTPSGGASSQAGTIYCWGDNVFGQIGIGTAANNAPVLAPTKVLYQP